MLFFAGCVVGFTELLILAVALALDAFSVGAVVGLKHHSRRQLFRLSYHFGLFQALMPLLGAFLGEIVLSFCNGWDKIIACAILVVLGAKMIISGWRTSSEKPEQAADPTRGWPLIGLSLAVSIDAFASGVSLVGAAAPLALSVTLIGVVTSAATLIAMRGARRLSRFAGGRLEIPGGVALIGIGIKMALG